MGKTAAIGVGIAVAVVASAVTLFLLYRGEGEILSRADLDRARARWQEQGPPDYDLLVVVSGAQQGEHRIEVREGRVASMTTGGRPASRTAWEYWTVDGMFRFLSDELFNMERSRVAYGVDEASDVVLRIVFDETYGYPRRFLRHVLGGGGRGIEWEIREFTPKAENR